MGDFKILIHAMGGHGCERKAKAGEQFHGCGYMGCPDCLASEFVKKLADAGFTIHDATFTHWPASMTTTHTGRNYNEADEVVDDLNEFVNIPGSHLPHRTPRLRKRIKGKFNG